ncbi:MAG: hypothetical protein AABX33_05525 [Nanoarchaeota archaeon]
MNLKFKDIYLFAFAIALLILIFFYVLFGITGAKVALGIIFISLPFYMLLSSFELNEGEKMIFSILMGLTLFSSVVYLLGLVIPFKIAIIVTFLLLISAAYLTGKYKSKKVL